MVRFTTVQDIYEKYKHLDCLLADKQWINEKDIKQVILHELWLAVAFQCRTVNIMPATITTTTPTNTREGREEG